MIQDIAPHQYHVAYKPSVPCDTDLFLLYRDGCIFASYDDNRLRFPTASDLRLCIPDLERKARYLFRIDSCAFFDLPDTVLQPFGCWKYESTAILRNALPRYLAFAGVTGAHIDTWYRTNRFCSLCGTKLIHDLRERAMRCPSCQRVIYPTIAPSVIVGVTNGSRLLLTRYAKSHSSHQSYALVAGYTEVGETLEQTVAREVMEEVGLQVTNIRYYKSQPWAFSGTLLAGFFCDVIGDTAITLEQEELSEAVWFEREELPPPSSTASLTSEMIAYFRNGCKY